MAYNFAQQFGGQCTSTPPKAKAPACPSTSHATTAPGDELTPGQVDIEVAQHGETVLLVDDESTVCMLLADVLGELGYTVIEAVDSSAGLKLLRSDVHIDLLVTDVGLPGGMNGRQMAEAGMELRPGLKTLFITGYAENAVMGYGQLGVGMGVLTKPFAVEVLGGGFQKIRR